MRLIDGSTGEDVHPGQVNLANPGWASFRYALSPDEIPRAEKMHDGTASAQGRLPVYDLNSAIDHAASGRSLASSPQMKILDATEVCRLGAIPQIARAKDSEIW